ncbi:Putative NAD dependent epimerase/dehydratase family protein [[Torrubiella] hemipterigena]|uniref:Putative NAD dependent epimerase/dehydratase family protein n=1 Tax=[Torrubiella] hemipterigena TaxID=1531966 RepID=A0A0A1SKU7_9HYPO|nr:Putative NAD dependent epimerase/dehydratase family protein [[Torrubiella] hemipterigena]
MTQRTVIVTGATGLLGRQVTRKFKEDNWNVKGTGYSRADGVDVIKVDLQSQEQIVKLLDDSKPDVIVHCAAQRFPDKVDKDPEDACALNITASKILAQEAAARNVFLIYISTDYVFPGRPGDAPYEANAVPGPTNLYGQTKFDGEKVILEEYAKSAKEGSGIVLRVPVLYGKAETPSESAVNVLMDSVWKAETEKVKIKMDHWALRYPTCTEDIGRVCKDIATKYLATEDKKNLPKILQFSSEDKMTKYEICQHFGNIMGLSTDNIEPNTEGNDPNATVQRPFDCHLSTKGLQGLGIDISTVNFIEWWRGELGAFQK